VTRSRPALPAGRWLAPLALIAALVSPAFPQEAYPNKFIRIVVGYAAGGGTDVVARVVGEKLAERLGQPVVIENRPGGGARLAVEYVAKESPDGYTVLIGGGSEMAITPLIAKTGYSPLTSFVPLTIAIEMPLILLVPPDHPAKTAPELAAWAKANPEKSNYATTAPGFTLPAELFKLRTGAPGVAITYKSAAEGAVALMNGAAAWATFTPPGVVNLVKDGKLRALAVTTAARSPDLPEVPTMQELGIDIAITNWNGFFVPVGTPKPITDKLATELRHVVLQTEVNAKLRGMLTNPVSKTPAEIMRHIENDLRLWKDVIEKARLKLGNQQRSPYS
jgi:tripartite-type tricarboxylate transporter receptor subunit TctC